MSPALVSKQSCKRTFHCCQLSLSCASIVPTGVYRDVCSGCTFGLPKVLLHSILTAICLTSLVFLCDSRHVLLVEHASVVGIFHLHIISLYVSTLCLSPLLSCPAPHQSVGTSFANLPNYCPFSDFKLVKTCIVQLLIVQSPPLDPIHTRYARRHARQEQKRKR